MPHEMHAILKAERAREITFVHVVRQLQEWCRVHGFQPPVKIEMTFACYGAENATCQLGMEGPPGACTYIGGPNRIMDIDVVFQSLRRRPSKNFVHPQSNYEPWA